MKKSLGEYDSFIELNEVALKSFTQDAMTKPNPALHVEAIARTVGINVRTDYFKNTHNRMSALYILSVYQSFELFLDEFKEEFKKYWTDWIPKQDGDTLLSNTLANINQVNPLAKLSLTDEHFALVDYYRIVRNHFMHKDDKSHQTVKQKHSAILKHHAVFQQFYKTRSSPSLYEDLNIDDFFLFSKAVKETGIRLSHLGRPSDEMLSILLAKPKFKKFKGNQVRLEQALANEAAIKFNIDIKNSTILNLAIQKLQTC